MSFLGFVASCGLGPYSINYLHPNTLPLFLCIPSLHFIRFEVRTRLPHQLRHLSYTYSHFFLHLDIWHCRSDQYDAVGQYLFFRDWIYTHT